MTHAAAVTSTVRSPRRRPNGPAALERARARPVHRANAPHHPVVVEHVARRAANSQLRLADAITGFAGSMPFVYIHAVVFACWMLFVESDPWPTLTLIVSLEAIFLSAFVMIGQNRQVEFQRAKADHDYSAQEQELRLNTELTRETHTLTTELHGRVLGTLASQVEAHDAERVTPRPEPTQQLMLVGPWDRRATAHTFGARLSGPTRSVEKPGTRLHGR
jgi:uncharacterized membrane protein